MSKKSRFSLAVEACKKCAADKELIGCCDCDENLGYGGMCKLSRDFYFTFAKALSRDLTGFSNRYRNAKLFGFKLPVIELLPDKYHSVAEWVEDAKVRMERARSLAQAYDDAMEQRGE